MLKLVAAILYSRVLDVILLAWVGIAGQTALTSEQDYNGRVIKFVIIIFAFAIATYEHIYRRNITENFTISHAQREAKREAKRAVKLKTEKEEELREQLIEDDPSSSQHAKEGI